MIHYQIEDDLSVTEFREILIESTLGERRPVASLNRLQKMLEYGNLIITARLNKKLIGVSRSLTDYSFCTYLSDLAVHKDFQKKGIGKELIRRTSNEAPEAKLILLAAPEAIPYYRKIGMTQYEFCYYLDHSDNLI